LLNDRRAATHWSVAGALAQRYPRVQVDADAIYVCDEIKDSDGMRQLWTSAGVTAGIDLALAVVEHDFGHALALQVARDLVMYLKRPAASRSSAYPWPRRPRSTAQCRPLSSGCWSTWTSPCRWRCWRARRR
jgi:transcriptional regulator GlxA family with amidase domain